MESQNNTYKKHFLYARMKIKNGNHFLSTFTVYLCCIFIFIVAVSFYASNYLYKNALKTLSEDGEIKLELHITYLRGILEKYESLPELLATNKRLTNLLVNPGSKERIQALNTYLETINSISDASDTYLMDREGLTIAASNWDKPHPFVGRNFSYRPYFKQAIQGHLGKYFALGTTSEQRGYYFAFPVRNRNRIIGVLAVKILVDSIEKSWRHKNQIFLVTDPDGVIFLSTNPFWKFMTLSPLEPEVRDRIIKSKRYSHADLQSLDLRHGETFSFGKVVQLRDTERSRKKNYLLQSAAMDDAGWNVQILSDIQGVKRSVFWRVAMLNTLFALGGLVHLIVRQRRQRTREAKVFQEKSRKDLELAKQQLETSVQQRTGELTETNNLLRKEIEERRRAEKDLKNTRSELIHAAKLAALGQMSAGINHELNQPLAAIRSYSENCKLLFKKDRVEDAFWNLDQIIELTERMARIGGQLKMFARKSSGVLTRVPLHSVIDGALEIVKPTLKKVEAEIEIVILPDTIEVKANYVLLQQVVVNLLQNSLHAVAEMDCRKISVFARKEDNLVTVSIEDSGQGISRSQKEKIFEPFYTTKKSGHGLGLGLAITKRILTSMNGDIHVVEKSGGARFEFFLQGA